jgi:hypothetical protein
LVCVDSSPSMSSNFVKFENNYVFVRPLSYSWHQKEFAHGHFEAWILFYFWEPKLNSSFIHPPSYSLCSQQGAQQFLLISTMRKKGLLQLALQLGFLVALDICN